MLDEVKDMKRNWMDVKTMMNHSKYMGLPVIFGISMKKIVIVGGKRLQGKKVLI